MKKFYLFLLALCLFTGANAQVINFPDANFKAKLLSATTTNTVAQTYSSGAYSNIRIDSNNNGEIEVSEALNVAVLDVSNTGSSANTRISDLTGLNFFINLKKFYCYDNLLTNLDLSSFVNLEGVGCDSNFITNLNITGLNNLRFIMCSGNRLNNLDLANKPLIEYLYCSSNYITSLDLTGLPLLSDLEANSNLLTSLNLSGQTNLESIQCMGNQLTTLDVSQQLHLGTILCGYNPNMETLYMKNGSRETGLNLSNMPGLKYVCVDESELNTIQIHINNNGSTNCAVNTYCNFTLGGNYYIVEGNNKIDFLGNGCDSTDAVYPNLKFNISDGVVTTGTFISGNQGSYSIPVVLGTHIFTPVLENINYFSVSPSSLTVSFPNNDSSPFNQNFCISPDGVHPDLEVVILPLNAARAGFDVNYKLFLKNKGNQVQSGSIDLTFNDAILDFISSSLSLTNQTINNLSWNFTNIQPFETREIDLTFNVNSPVETPAVNDGDILNYTAVVTSSSADETPADNTFVLNQRVVNSFDPNDKTCLEGTTISPSEVGKYVHYMIRFENTGTANAQNIVVKDMINLNRFDITSLIPLKGSHSFRTKIFGSKVEFIFENINLPFDDANNDGYVAFKIKTKPTLVTGNTFSNSASIYFDYNFPVETNAAITTIQALSTQDFNFGDYFMIYPNPIDNVLNIETKQTIAVTSISIYNQLGQLVLVVPNAQAISKVDVSTLASGNYFIKINSDKGVSNAKFIKK